jgi:hypothetical protein
MNYRSFLNIISIAAAVASPVPYAAQDPRLERLAMQYRLMNEPSAETQTALRLSVANALLDEGRAEKARAMTLHAGSGHAHHAMFINGKAFFLEDNYEESLALLRQVDEERLPAELRKELSFYMTLNHHHLLQPDSAKGLLTGYLLTKGLDTSGVEAFYSQSRFPASYSIKKANNRSLIPGGGLFYVDEPRKALTSILLQSGFAGYAAYSVYTRHYVTALLTGASQFMRFYGGGRRASRKIAYTKNRQRYIVYVLQLNRFAEKKFFGL